MVILEVGITNFGKLHGVNLFFQKGVNVIYGDNEAGKSTIHAFIRAMLFGIERQRGRASKTDEFSKYEPWENPASYEGVMRFQKGRGVYRIYRCFSHDNWKTEIVNETTGEELTEEELKGLLGGITESSFTNTVCISQMKAEPGQTLSEELQNTMVNYLSAGEPEWDMRKAFVFLAEEKKRLIKQYQPKLEEELQNAEEDLRIIEEELLQQTIRKEEAQEELEEMRKQIKQEKQAYENSSRQKRLMYIELFLSAVSFFIMVFCYVMGYWREGVWIFGILALICAFLAWKGHALTSVSVAFMEAEKREKTLYEQIQKVEWKLEQMKERAVIYQSGLEGCRQQVEENRKLYQQISAVMLAEQTLKQVAGSMQKNVSEHMRERMSHLLSEITDNKYNKVFIQENNEIFLYGQNRKIPLYQLSRGAAEQVYLALRLAAADSIMGYESMPLLLDETFVYYDKERLQSTLAALTQQARQILLFTCHQREKEILDNMEKTYHLLEL